jgi:nucleoside-diphosphate-sugar epimerase
MIIGNGLVAKAFYDNYANRDDVLIFASGVSNSSNTDPKEFFREKALLESFLSERKKIIYFSTYSIEDPSLADSSYIMHKLKMEGLVKAANDYLIFRLPQVAGKTDNPNTLLNFLYHKIKNQEPLEVFSNATRNIIDIDHIEKIASYIIDKNLIKNNILNICSPQKSFVLDLVKIFEDILHKKANYKLINKGESFDVDVKFSTEVAKKLNIFFHADYLRDVISKYYLGNNQ